MSCTKIREALEPVLPGSVFDTQAPENAEDGSPILEYIVLTDTGFRSVYAEGKPFATVSTAVVTVATQDQDSTIPSRVVAALAAARVAMAPAEHSYDDETATYYTDIPCEVI